MSVQAKKGEALPKDGDGTSRVSLEQWMEWKRLCDSARCSPEARAALHHFGQKAFDNFRRGALALTGRASVQSPDNEGPESQLSRAWGLFESHLVADQTKQGKAYKDWMFEGAEKAHDPMGYIVTMAFLLMRDVVRSYVRSTQAKGYFSSLDAPANSQDAAGANLEDLLMASPAARKSSGAVRIASEWLPQGSLLASTPSEGGREEVWLREYKAIAEDEAHRLFDSMTDRQRIAVMADNLGVSLSHQAVTVAAGRGKSVLNVEFNNVATGVKRRIDAAYASEQVEGLLLLYELTGQALMDLCVDWGRSEKRCAGIFLASEERMRSIES